MDKRYNPIEVEEKWVDIWSKEILINKDAKETFFTSHPSSPM